MDYFICTLITGLGATALMDLWGILRRPLLGIAAPDYSLVGRWLAHMRHGRFHHQSIKAAAPVHGERALGWTAHYAIGLGFAALLLGIWGVDWVRQPTLGPALFVGIGTVAAPFLVMQPAMGAGIASSRTSHPGSARLQSLITHAIFGFGLYAAGWAAHLLYAWHALQTVTIN